MKAIRIDRPGGPEVLIYGPYPTPVPGPEEVLVRIAATALNRADVLQREGRYPPPPGASPLPGLEIAGTVVASGEDVVRWKPGDRVMGLLAGGGYAEYATIHQDIALPLPSGCSFEEAAAIPEAFMTAYQALYWLGGLEEGQTVLVHAGASGVGTAALQLARATGSTVLATASARKHPVLAELGVAACIDYRTEDVVARVHALTGGRGADLILDFVGAPTFEQNLRSLAMDGRLILLAAMGGHRLDVFDLRLLFARRAQVLATTLRNRSLAYKIALAREFAEVVSPLFEAGTIRPVIDSVWPWTEVAEAHRHMEANANIGKIVLRISEETSPGAVRQPSMP